MATIPFNTASIIRCYTTEHMNNLIQKDPSLKGRLDAYEQLMQAEIRRNGGRGDGGSTGGINVEVINP